MVDSPYKKYYKCTTCRVVKPLAAFSRLTKPKSVSRWVSDACKECTNAYNRAYYQKNKARIKAATAKWAADNPERMKVIRARNRIKRRVKVCDKSITVFKIRERDDNICQLCNKSCTPETESIDHIIPVTRGGQHVWDNVQLAHRTCNAQKNNRTMQEWATAKEQAANKRPTK